MSIKYFKILLLLFYCSNVVIGQESYQDSADNVHYLVNGYLRIMQADSLKGKNASNQQLHEFFAIN